MRLDYCVVWSTGMGHIDEILGILRKYKDLELMFFKKYVPQDFMGFVGLLYSLDTVPLEHLQAKNAYLNLVKPEVYIMLLKNHNPREVVMGEDGFRHIQSLTLNRFKWEVRERFNPFHEGERSEEHVFHSSDYESQVISFFKQLGWDIQEQVKEIDHLSFHVELPENYSIERVKIDELNYSLITDGENIPSPLNQSPHYRYVMGDKRSDKKTYKDYWEKWKGIRLLEDHTPAKFDELIKGFKYLESPFENHFVVVKDNVIVDGVHRLAIMLSRGIKECVAVKI